MQELLSQLKSNDLAAVIVTTLTFVTGLIVWLSLIWRWHRRTEMEIALKMELVNRGMSAEEIERVLRASVKGARTCSAAEHNDAAQAELSGCR
jgi:hypothetical protein